MLRLICLSSFCLFASLQATPVPANKNTSNTAAPSKKAESFKPFTGKVIANKVRIRAKPDLDSHIVRQINKNDLLLVVGEEGDFFAVEPLKDTKAYIFRSYVLDNVIEANRVNIRLEPHIDAPIIGQLQAGDHIQGTVCAMNHKWLEIAPPKGTRFFVSKEFISQAGGPEYLSVMEKRRWQAEEALASAYLSAEAECKKNYEEMAPQQATDQLQAITRNYSDFPEITSQAKEGLALLKETYLNKKIAYLESKAELSPTAKEALIAKHKAEHSELLKDAGSKPEAKSWAKKTAKRDNANFWDAVEESLYLSWTAFHSGKSFDDFYAEQKANASVISGYLERYDHDVKNKPGDYILRSDTESPTAYLYSTQIDLEPHTGKHVTLLAAPRPNNHFAFPAYYVIAVE